MKTVSFASSVPFSRYFLSVCPKSGPLVSFLLYLSVDQQVSELFEVGSQLLAIPPLSYVDCAPPLEIFSGVCDVMMASPHAQPIVISHCRESRGEVVKPPCRLAFPANHPTLHCDVF